MKIQDQLCSLEQAKKLKELGVKQESLFYHLPDTSTRFAATHYKRETYLQEEGISAFNVAELGEMLPKEVDHNYNEHSSFYICYGYTDPSYEGGGSKPVVWYEDNDLDEDIMEMKLIGGKTEAEARAAMLIYLIEKKITHPNSTN